MLNEEHTPPRKNALGSPSVPSSTTKVVLEVFHGSDDVNSNSPTFSCTHYVISKDKKDSRQLKILGLKSTRVYKNTLRMRIADWREYTQIIHPIKISGGE